MSRLTRSLLLVGVIIISLGLAFLLRKAAHDLVIVPLAYAWWLARLIYLSIPQFIRWAFLVLCLGIAVMWQLLPEPKPLARIMTKSARKPGPVEFLAVWLQKARRSNYYKWQVAYRLGRTARALQLLWGVHAAGVSPNAEVRKYLNAGTNHSFVEYAGSRTLFQHRHPTPLDLDPAEAVEYLESQMEMRRAGQARSS